MPDIGLNEEWVRQAACAGMATADHDPWFPRVASRMGRPFAKIRNMPPEERALVEEAKAICGPCPVRVQCLNYALRIGEKEGIWGGYLPGERMGMRVRVIA